MPVPLPQFPHLDVAQLPRASTLLFYGGNKLTQFAGNTLYKHRYAPPAFHAAFYLGSPAPGIFLNVGKFKVLQDVSLEFRSTRRVDALVYNVRDDVRQALCKTAVLDASHPKVGISLPDYDGVAGYLGFGWRWLVKKLGGKPKARENRKDFCSDNVVDLFSTEGVEVSKLSSEATAPWDLLEWAVEHPLECQKYTLFVGEEYARRYGGVPVG